ncbi:hypothetical protein BAE44_0017123 [Dichanthelium oligosanthes]|uniref:Uncharacterized protein n=1 Tax=Dichanthelium oligosanthes TaxID=888268 RepID=A0A1E5V9P9_9POAL|nr:hypothetical protein BAE44_0017123 [Dichanthelium oligosanthes]
MAWGGGGGEPGPGRVKAGSRPPWVGLAAAVWVQVAAGSAYVFPLYSHAVKEALGYDQKALTMLGVGNDVGENVGLLPGMLANRLPPWLILVIGSACALFGFGTLWLAVTKTVAMPYWVVRSPHFPFLLPSPAVTYLLFGIMILLLLAPLAIPLKMTLYPNKQAKEKPSTLAPSYSTDSLSGADPENSEPLLGSASTTLGTGVNESDDSTDLDFLLAVGVTVLNNLAQVGMSVGANDTTILLCLFGFCNFVGRILGGSVSEYFVRSRMLPRPFWMMCTQIIMVVTFLLFATGLHSLIYVSTTLLGICYGVQFAVMIPTVSELFGLKDFGLMYNFMLLVNPLGAFFFSALLAGYIYDKEAARQHPGVLESSNCYGPDCFRVTFYVCAIVCCCGTLLSVLFIARIKPVYQMLYASGSFRHPRSQQQLH